MMISSQRLDLISMTPHFLRAALRGDLDTAEHLIGARVPADWPDISDVIKLRLRQLEADPSLLPWLLRAIVVRDTRQMVGHIGFHTAPRPEYLEPYSPGAVELGYEIAPSHRRHGFAREAALALMNWAQDTHSVRCFIVSIAPDNVPSQTLAAQLGFVKIGSHIDEEDGLEDILERKVSTDQRRTARSHPVPG